MFYPIVFVPSFIQLLCEVCGLSLVRSIRAAYSSDAAEWTYRESFDKWTRMKAVTSKEGVPVCRFPLEICREGGFVLNKHHIKNTKVIAANLWLLCCIPDDR